MSEEKVVAGQYLHTEIPLQSLSVTDKKLNVKASDLETLLDTLNGKVATQTTLAAILNKIIAAPSTAEKQDLIKSVLDTIADKDYATQTTLGELKQKIDELYDKVEAIIDENNTAKVTVSGTMSEVSSQQYTESSGAVRTYTKAQGASRIELYVESGRVRIRTDGQPCTLATGEPLGEGFGAMWVVDSISVYFVDDAVITVVSR